ncbi:MAG: Gfo/Idh/MocA family oxidoreductase [Kiritimatiellaeota bacterium]|nr:Gfo/Idh/MocA family oxidoreductase [Kiritimatiellota bacterium]
MLKVGMIGAGIIAGTHRDALATFDDMALTAVADVSIDKARRLCDRAYDNYTAMLEQEPLDIALVTLPHGLHAEAAIACAKRGLHVFLEKPMANTVAECEAIIAACKSHNVALMVGHLQRYLAHNRKIRELIQSGAYGDLAFIVETRCIDYFVPSRPRWFLDKAMAGGGITMNYGAHSLDKIRWITGREVMEAYGKNAQHCDGRDIEGGSQSLIQLSGNVTATLNYSAYVSPGFEETLYFLTKGVIKAGHGVWTSTGGGFTAVATDAQEEPFRWMWRDFRDAILHGTPPPVGGAYGMDIIRTIRALLDEGRMV